MIGVNRTETQFQIIIGPSVAKVYEAVCKQGELNSISETSEAGKEEKIRKNLMENSWKENVKLYGRMHDTPDTSSFGSRSYQCN